MPRHDLKDQASAIARVAQGAAEVRALTSTAPTARSTVAEIMQDVGRRVHRWCWPFGTNKTKWAIFFVLLAAAGIAVQFVTARTYVVEAYETRVNW